jgi:hypothetical protein
MNNPNNPNDGLVEIFSKTVSNIISLNFGRNYVNVDAPRVLNLNPGAYFISLETTGGQIKNPLQAVATPIRSRSDYPQGISYSMSIPQEGLLEGVWQENRMNIFFQILGI